jgi:hypothetical protein
MVYVFRLPRSFATQSDMADVVITNSNTALFPTAFLTSARSEWYYPCYTCFYLQIVYDGHCKLSLQIELRKVGIDMGN